MALLLILLLSAGSFAENDPNCTVQEFAECFIVLEAIAQREDLALPATQEELNLVCRKLQQGVRCVEDHSFRCFTAPQKRVFKSVVSDSRHVIDDICVQGKLQQDYLRHAPCLKNVSTDEKKCANQYKKLANNHGGSPDEPNTAENVNEGLKMHCCAFAAFVECQHEHILRDCGRPAHHWFQVQLDRMSGSLLNEHCALFTHGSNACLFSPSADAHRTSFSCIALAAALAILLVVQR